MFDTHPACQILDVRPAIYLALAGDEPSHIHIPRPSRLAAQHLSETLEVQPAPEEEAA
jgi:hypothetical protein